MRTGFSIINDFKIKVLITAFALFISPVAHALPCERNDLYKKIFREPRIIPRLQALSEFGNRVDAYKAEYAKALADKSQVFFSEIHLPEQKLALIEAVNSRLGHNPLDVQRLLLSGSTKDRKALEKILKNFDMEYGVELGTVDKTVDSLYALANREQFARPYLKSLLPPDKKVVMNLIRKRVESSLLKRNMREAFEEINILSNPRMTERFAEWTRRNPNVWSLSVQSAIDTSLVLQFHSPYFITPPSGIRWFKVSDELLNKVGEQGFPALKDALYATYGKSAWTEELVNYTRKSYFRALKVSAVYFTIANWDRFKTLYKLGRVGMKMHFMTEAELREYESTHFNLRNAQEEQLLSALQGWVDFNHPLTPEHVWEEAKLCLMQDESTLKLFPDPVAKMNHEAPALNPAVIRAAADKTLQKMVDDGDINAKVKREFDAWSSSRN